ncbi:UDP-Gal or UDP-GlcNAc-dependent glycosyltransferase [Diplonema papillatum]|nr:UDP-Gal or UDP-GlcNAc-dependent glycosyltransferase [Diplonema papillatum]
MPSLRFPLLILALLVFSLTLFAEYAAHLTQHPLYGAKAKGPGDAAAAQGQRHHGPAAHSAELPKRGRDSPPPRPAGAGGSGAGEGGAGDRELAAGVAARYPWLFEKRHVAKDPKVTPSPLVYDPAPTPDPRGAPLVRHSKPAAVNATTKLIATADRRAARIPPLIPRIEDPDFISPNDGVEKAKVWDIVIGIPSIDTPTGARRRKYQRESWLRYSNVYRHPEHPTGSVLVKYLLAHHPATNYTCSQHLRNEASEHNDIIFFDMREGVWDQARKPWAVEVGMSRKAYAWYCYVADNYKANWVMKGDDDEFVRTLFLQSELRSLPFDSRTYYGRIMHWGVKKGSSLKFPFSGGMSVTMTYDLVDWIRDSRYVEQNVDYYHEDVMVGRWFYSANVPLNVVRDCRHHDVHKGANKQKQTDKSLCIHHLQDQQQEYTDNFRRYPDDSPPKPKKHALPEADQLGNRFLDIGGSC